MRAALVSLQLALLAGGGAGQEPAQAPAAALRERAAAAENEGRFGEAADSYLALAAADPGRAEWVIAAGRCLGRSGRYNDAIDLLTKRRADFPGVLDLVAMLARTHLLKVESEPGVMHPELSYADAAKLAEEILAVDPDHAEAAMILAQARYGLGDQDAAARAAEDAVRRHPDKPGAQILVGRIAFDRFKQQKEALRATQPSDPEHAAMVAAIDAQRRRAQAAFERAVSLDPGRTFARIALGDLAALDHDLDQALEQWMAALAIDPAAKVDHAWIGREVDPARRRAAYEGALARYRARAGADPAKAATLQWYVARALYDQGDLRAARQAFGAVLDGNKDYVNAHYWAALCAFKLDDQDAAEAEAAAYAAASATGFADVLRALTPEARGEVRAMLQYLGDRAYRQGRLDHSRDLNHVLACLLDSADAWNNYAFLCRETGRFADAFAGYEHALEKEPDSPQLWNDAAVVLQYHLAKPQNLARARQMYGRALELAAKVLADEHATAVARERAQKAQSDARLNLDKLPR